MTDLNDYLKQISLISGNKVKDGFVWFCPEHESEAWAAYPFEAEYQVVSHFEYWGESCEVICLQVHRGEIKQGNFKSIALGILTLFEDWKEPPMP